MQRSRSGIISILLLTAAALAQQAIHVPPGKSVMINGSVDDGWKDASVTELTGVAMLYIKRSDEYIWLALKLQSNDGAVDLYLSPQDSNIYDLHASAKLGERKLQNGTWPDWAWWNNEGWVANVSRVDSFEKRTFLPTKVREYQINRSRFPGEAWKIMLEIQTPAEPEWKVTAYPAGASTTSTKGWLVLQLD